MPDEHQVRGRLRFGVFELDLRAGELRKQGMRVRLQEQPFQVLTMLVEHPGEVVTREELQKKLWSADTFVDFDHGLNKAINKIRDALGDSADTPRFVETVARRGYRFLADVRLCAPVPVATSVQQVEAAVTAPPPLLVAVPPSVPHAVVHDRRRWTWIAVAAVLALGTAGGIWRVHSATSPQPAIHSLAVLPLESLSSDPSQDYFADGMTDELITELG